MQSTRRWRVWTSRVGIETPRFRHAASKIRRALPRFRSSTLRASSSDTTPGLRLSLSVLRSVNARQPKWFLRRMQGNRTRARDRSETEFDWHSPVLALNCCVAARLRDRTLEHSEGRWGLEDEDNPGGPVGPHFFMKRALAGGRPTPATAPQGEARIREGKADAGPFRVGAEPAKSS